MKSLRAAIFFAAFLPAIASAAPMIEVGQPANKTLIVVTPEAQAAVGQGAWATVTLAAGTFTGIRAQVIPFHGDGFSVAIEGMYGTGILDPFPLRETFGAGVRVSFTVASDGENDALLISPGVDVLFASGKPGRGLAEYSSYGDVVYLAATADISYVHQFARHFGFEVGLRIGGSVVVNDGEPKQTAEPIGGKVLPELSLFTGIRF